MRNLWSEGRGKMLVAIAAGWVLSIGTRMMYPVLLPHLRADYGFDLATAGLLLTILFFTYALGQLPGGLLADRIGEGTIMVTSALLAAGTLMLIATARSISLLFVATALFGLAIALYGVARFTSLSDLYPDQVGAANGVIAAASDAGQSVLPPVAGIIAVTVTWQYGFGFTVPLFCLVAAWLWVALPARTSEPSSAGGTLSLERAGRTLSELRKPSVVHGTTVLVFGISIWQAFTGFYPTYLIEVKGISPTVASGLFGLFFALGIVIKPLTGVAYDRIGVRGSLMAVIGTTGVALALIPMVEGFWPLLILTILVSSVLGINTTTQSYLIVALSRDVQGTGFGFLRTVAFGIGAASPVLFGIAADGGFFDEGFLMLAGLAGVMFVLVGRIPSE